MPPERVGSANEHAVRSRADGKNADCTPVSADWIWFYVTLAGSAALRLTLLDFESGDYKAFLSNWYNFIVQHGRWHALSMEFASYPPLYLYFLSVSTLLPLPKLYAIKLITLLSDYIACWFVWRLVRKRHPDGTAQWLALTAFLFMPTVVMNGSSLGPV